MLAAPGDTRDCAVVTLLPTGSRSHDHTRPPQSLQPPWHGRSVPIEVTVATEGSSPSEIYGKIDDSLMEGKTTLSALSIHLPAREWWVIKIYWKLEKTCQGF